MDCSIKTKSITLVLTHQCNLRCVYCYEKHKDDDAMSFETANKILDKELTMDDGIPRAEISLFGGEPLLEFDLIKRLVAYARGKDYPKDFIFFITTNGVLLDEERKAWLRENTDILQLGLSLDGTKEMHDLNRCGSFDAIDKDFFLKTYPDQGIKMTISQLSLPHLAEGVIYCHELGFSDVSCNLAYGIDWSKEEYKAIYERELQKLIEYYLAHPEVTPCAIFDIGRLKGLKSTNASSLRRCGAGWAMRSYDADGTFYPCQHFLPLSIGQEKATFSHRIDFEHQPVDAGSFSEKCRACCMKNICPSCYGENYAATGNINERDMRLCPMFKIQFRALAYFASELFACGRLASLPKRDAALILAGAMAINKEIVLD